jgi:hypothetical protein
LKDDNTAYPLPTLGNRFAAGSAIPFLLILGVYALWVIFGLGGLRSDHRLLLIGLPIIYFSSNDMRKLVIASTFLLIYWAIYDAIRLWPNYEYMPIHIGDLYNLEKSLFGIQTSAGLLTLNEYFGIHNHTGLDIYTAIIYLCWIPVPLAFAFYLFFTNHRKVMVHFWFGFFLVSQIGLVLQYLYPSAPPWYVELYGIDSTFQEVGGNPGRLINFDHYFGVNLFSGMYSLNGNVYAAVPSLHCAFPIIQLYFAAKHKFKKWTIGYLILMFSTWFSAVYTNHHYVIDVLAGIGTALAAILIYRLLMKTRVKQWLDWQGTLVRRTSGDV